MKIFIILIVLCLIANTLAGKHSDNMKNAIAECKIEENISEKDYNKDIDHDFENTSRAMKCFIACVSEKIGILRDNIVQDEVILRIGREDNKEQLTNGILEKCKNIQGEDRCDMAFRFHVCVQNTKKEILLKEN